MAIVKISGHSDDIIVLEGDIENEITATFDEDERDYLAFSDGTVLNIVYDHDGVWRINTLTKGVALLVKDENPGDGEDRYSDIVTLEGPVHWVVHGKSFIQ